MPVHDGRVAGPGVARSGQKLVPREPSKDGKRRIVHEHRVPPRDAGEKGDERPGDDVPLKVIDQNRAAGDATEGREQAHGLVVGEMVEEQRAVTRSNDPGANGRSKASAARSSISGTSEVFRRA